MTRRTSRRCTSRRCTSRRRASRCFTRNPKFLGLLLMPNKVNADVLPRTFDKCLRFAQQKLGDLGHVGFHISKDAGTAGRHFAYCQQHPNGSLSITFAPRAAALPDEHRQGLMFHELGHAIDFRYPGGELTRRIGSGIPSESERRADEIARRVFGHTIQYDPSIGHVQCVACDGVSPRPRGLK